MAPHSSTLAWKIPWVEKPGTRGCKESARLNNFTYKRYQMIFLFLNLTFLCMRISRAIYVNANGSISFFFNGQVIFHCIEVPHFLYPFFCWWTFRRLLCLGYCKQCCKEPGSACIFSNTGFPSGCMPWGGVAGSQGSSIYRFLRTLHTVLHKWYTHLCSLQQCMGLPFLHTLSNIYCL